MRQGRTTALPLLTLVAMSASVPVQAALITEYSGDGNDQLMTAGSVTSITPHSAWGDVSDNAGLAAGTADWISYADTGVGGIVAPDTTDRTDPAEATAHFQRTFSMSGVGGDGQFNLWVLADDTATVTLTGPDGSSLFNAYGGQIDPCAPGGTGDGLGCVEEDMGTHSQTLANGDYTLDIYAYQTNEDVFGAQYALQYEQVPEPGSLVLLGAGLVGAGFAARRRRKA